jgi:hypothetical protein
MVTILSAKRGHHCWTPFLGVTGSRRSGIEALYTVILIQKIAEQPRCMR